MSSAAPSVPNPADAPPAAALRHLDDFLSGLSALEVLDAVAWDGPALDPATLTAPELLAWL